MSQKTKITYDEVYEFIKSKGCELLSDSYINMKQKLLIKCSCGENYETPLDSFKNKNRTTCRKCSNKKLSNSSKLTIEYVSEFIKEHGCELISENYVGAREKLDIRCICGKVFSRSFNKFKSGQVKCNSCIGRRDWNLETVKNFIEVDSESGCVLISNSFENRKQKLQIICDCGNYFYTDFHSFLNANKRKCNGCSSKIQAEKTKKGINYLREYVSNNSESVLLSEDYSNYYETLDFKCKCGNQFETCFVSFMNGKTKCSICSPSSKLEHKAEIFFKEKQIRYHAQYSFDNLLSPKSRKLKFDFAIFNENEELLFLLELDGEQHFKPSNGFGGIEKFEQMKLHDQIKNEYCKTYGINLERVSYKDIKNLDNVLSALICKYDNPVPSL